MSLAHLLKRKITKTIQETYFNTVIELEKDEDLISL